MFAANSTDRKNSRNFKLGTQFFRGKNSIKSQEKHVVRLIVFIQSQPYEIYYRNGNQTKPSEPKTIDIPCAEKKCSIVVSFTFSEGVSTFSAYFVEFLVEHVLPSQRKVIVVSGVSGEIEFYE